MESEDIKHKGRLTIFFGYAIGVGKTFTMLKKAQELKAKGKDVVIGYIEPHERPETQKQKNGLEELPLKEIIYKDRLFKEFDVDRAIERHPEIILVDELAHTNVKGSKNKKRYLDVIELLNNGIDVYTTANVQNIEGLQDMIDEMTTVDVAETIPDEIFDYADEVLLIDIEPNNLIERMKQGLIYNKNKAALALEHFFKHDNLSALRELAMRRGADRIEKKGHDGELETKVLVLVSPSPSAEKTIRVAARMAEAYHCHFSGMYVETRGELSEDSARNIKAHMDLVRDMGGDMIVKYSDDVVETVVNYVKLAGVTNLILGKTWQTIGLKVGLEEKFISRLPNIEIMIVPDSERFTLDHGTLKDRVKRKFKKRSKEAYQATNKVLDIHNLLAKIANEHHGYHEIILKEVTHTLAKAFERSVQIIYDDTKEVARFGEEDVLLFDTKRDVEARKWTEKNDKSAGADTHTIDDAKAIYFPLHDAFTTVGSIGFLTTNKKMSVTDLLVYTEIKEILTLVLSK